MSKWKCEICGSRFENFHAQGFDHKIYCPLCYFKKLSINLKKENQRLKSQLKQSSNVIVEIKKYLQGSYEMSIYTKSVMLDKDGIDDLFDILNKYKGDDK